MHTACILPQIAESALQCSQMSHLAGTATVYFVTGETTTISVGLLLNNLSVYHGCEIVFDSCEVPEQAIAAAMQVPDVQVCSHAPLFLLSVT